MHTLKEKDSSEYKYTIALEEVLRVVSLIIRDAGDGSVFNIKKTENGTFISIKLPSLRPVPLMSVGYKGLSYKDDTGWHSYSYKEYKETHDESKVRRMAREMVRDVYKQSTEEKK